MACFIVAFRCTTIRRTKFVGVFLRFFIFSICIMNCGDENANIIQRGFRISGFSSQKLLRALWLKITLSLSLSLPVFVFCSGSKNLACICILRLQGVNEISVVWCNASATRIDWQRVRKDGNVVVFSHTPYKLCYENMVFERLLKLSVFEKISVEKFRDFWCVVWKWN